jgi:hypothetical protein
MVKQYKDMDFNEAVDTITGDCLMQLIRGTPLRSIIFFACNAILTWKGEQK